MKVIIIGGVAAGMSAAAKLKRLKPDYDVTIYEKTDIISFGACGLPYFVGGFFHDSKELIARTPEEFKKTGIKLNIFHEVINVDYKNKVIKIKDLKNNKVFFDTYDKLMIATGAKCSIPPIENINMQNVCTLKSMADGLKLKELLKDSNNKNIVIIGGGFIGIEAIEALKNQNKNVTLIELGNRILENSFDKEITDILEEELKNTMLIFT